MRATYHVVGILLNEVRSRIEEAGHCLAFHSYDHKLDDTSTQYLYQLSRCRQIEYRLMGYRAPQSRLTPELIPRVLRKHNYEWLASSASSLRLKDPTLKDRLVWIPILFADFNLTRPPFFSAQPSGLFSFCLVHDDGRGSVHKLCEGTGHDR